MAQPITVEEPFGRDFCPSCGRYSEHTWLPGTEERTSKGEAISVLVRCGWSGCRTDRIIRRKDSWT